MRLLNYGGLLPLHAVHDNTWNICAVSIALVVHLGLVDYDMFVKGVIRLKPDEGCSDPRFAYLK